MARRPKYALFEQVMGFSNNDGEDFENPLARFVRMLHGFFEGVRVVKLDNTVFVRENPRTRYYIGCFHADVGGKDAAGSWVEKVQATTNFMKLCTRSPAMGGIITESMIEEVKESHAAIQDRVLENLMRAVGRVCPAA